MKSITRSLVGDCSIELLSHGKRPTVTSVSRAIELKTGIRPSRTTVSRELVIWWRWAGLVLSKSWIESRKQEASSGKN